MEFLSNKINEATINILSKHTWNGEETIYMLSTKVQHTSILCYLVS